MRGKSIRLNEADIGAIVVVVYGVLFADWNKDTSFGESPPFQGVRVLLLQQKFGILTNYRFGIGFLDSRIQYGQEIKLAGMWIIPQAHLL